MHRGVGCPAEPEKSDGYEGGAGDGWGKMEFGFGAAHLAGCLFALADEAEEVFVETVGGQHLIVDVDCADLDRYSQGMAGDCDHHADGHTEETQSDLPEIEAVVVREDEVEGAEEEIYYA